MRIAQSKKMLSNATYKSVDTVSNLRGMVSELNEFIEA
jgi:hypothetical protein